MATKVIAWNSGTGNITLTYTGEGNGTITVHSDDNNLDVARSQTITVKTSNNAVTKTVTINQGAKPDFSKEYLTFTALEAGTFTLIIPADITTTHLPSVSYSIDDGETWTTVSNSSSAVSVTTPTIQAGRKVLWKAVAQRFSTTTSNYCKFTSTGNVEISGNIMSLLYGDDFASQTELKNYSYIFYGLFRENTKLISAKNLVLPATTLTNVCYRTMFYFCSNLSEAPSILPATTLTKYCYASMFMGTAITKAPELPATTLATNCYDRMFANCSSLNSITCLATNISATACTDIWVSGVAASGTFVKAASMTSWTTGASGIPSGWTVVNDQ